MSSDFSSNLNVRRRVPLSPEALKVRERRPRPWLDLLQVAAGTTVAAIAFNVLLRPNGVAPGGVVGLSLVTSKFAAWEPAFTQWTLNGLIFLLSWGVFGRSFALRSLAGMAVLPAAVFLTREWTPWTHNPVLAAICGGVGVGAGMGIVFRANGSVGGFSTLALALHKYAGLTVDRGILLLDGVVIGAAALVFPAEQVLCALVCVALTGRTARGVMTGFGTSKVALIVSARATDITERVLNEIPLGVTKLSGHGAYTGNPCDVLMVVMRPAEVVRLKVLVRGVDPQAFMILCDANEVLGYGFKPHE